MAARLTEYRRKRDFSKTPEPEGAGTPRIAASEHLRFVIQKHDATRLHYDLRLELGDVFKSWAVTRGPSLDPAEKRLAVEVEDHPLEYGDFEGTIPKGEYGGGTVMIWDRGFWAPELDAPAQAQLDKGELKFVLAGTKLQGSWVLVRLKPKPGEKRSNWLLIKHKDRWATPGRDEVLEQDRSVASRRTMDKIAAGKGKPPAPFMTVGAKLPAASRWDSKATAQAQERLAVARQKAGPSTAVQMPKLTTPERILWPDGDGSGNARPLTKRDLAEYLLAIAPWMIAHLYGRPTSLLRAPEGIARETFFQRHPLAGQQGKVAAVTVDREHEPYLQIDDAQSIVSMSQLSVIELHPWNCAPFQPHVPGRLVFDLDPGPGVAFDRTIDAARDLRRRLDALGLVAFCKTTGGKGLHVVTPLLPDASVSWDQAKLFAQTVCAQMAADEPDRYVTKMTKALRAGKIYLDYLRNDFTATAVAPLSPRARPGAAVSMPLNWSQVRKGLEPLRFTILSAPQLLERAAPWKGYERSARPLKDAIATLLG
ncbi:MAG: non-homologous end-joining DNA ligase [Hyphomicrobiaceae bacterium]